MCKGPVVRRNITNEGLKEGQSGRTPRVQERITASEQGKSGQRAPHRTSGPTGVLGYFPKSNGSY